MSELLENTVKLLEQFNQWIKDDLSSKNIDNTNTARNSLRIEVDEKRNKVTSYGIFYLEYLSRGRGPGKFPPPEVIRDWVINKPVEISPFWVGKKIAEEGTEIYKNPSKGIELHTKINYIRKIVKENAPKWAKKDILIKIKQIQSKKI